MGYGTRGCCDDHITLPKVGSCWLHRSTRVTYQLILVVEDAERPYLLQSDGIGLNYESRRSLSLADLIADFDCMVSK